jgi:hypothetical protein
VPASAQALSTRRRWTAPRLRSYEKFQTDPHFKDYILFFEYFHGDNGRGCGASHQTGWTGLIANLIDQLHEEEETAGASAAGQPAGQASAVFIAADPCVGASNRSTSKSRGTIMSLKNKVAIVTGGNSGHWSGDRSRTRTAGAASSSTTWPILRRPRRSSSRLPSSATNPSAWMPT